MEKRSFKKFKGSFTESVLLSICNNLDSPIFRFREPSEKIVTTFLSDYNFCIGAFVVKVTKATVMILLCMKNIDNINSGKRMKLMNGHKRRNKLLKDRIIDFFSLFPSKAAFNVGYKFMAEVFLYCVNYTDFCVLDKIAIV